MSVPYKLFLYLLIVFFGSCAGPSKNLGTIPIKESLAPNKLDTLQPDRFMSVFERGIDFLATGNEPFWSLEIDFDKSMHFKMLEGFEISIPEVAGVNGKEANTMRYSGKTELGVLTVWIQKQACINDMSGEKTDYNVTIETKYNTDKSTKVYKGCGRYLSDYRLHDIWVLDSIGNKKMDAKDFTQGLPLFEFNLTEKNIYGNTGCNSITGSFEIKGKKISFGKLSTTRRACKDINFEAGYLNMLDNKIVPYQIRHGKLYLQPSANSIFVYKKTD